MGASSLSTKTRAPEASASQSLESPSHESGLAWRMILLSYKHRLYFGSMLARPTGPHFETGPICIERLRRAAAKRLANFSSLPLARAKYEDSITPSSKRQETSSLLLSSWLTGGSHISSMTQ